MRTIKLLQIGLPGLASFCQLLFLLACSEAMATTKPPSAILEPSSLTNTDVGSVGLSGSASISSSQITVRAAGQDIYTGTDSFNFTYRTLAGDGEVILRVDSLTNTGDWAKAGVMVRRSLDPSAANVSLLAHPEVGVSTQIRRAWGEGTSAVLASDFTMPSWLKLIRRGNNVKTYSSENGICWSLHSEDTLDLGGTVYVGMAVSSSDKSTRTTAVFGRLAINNSITAHSSQCLTSGLISSDIGSTGATGSALYSTANGGTYTVKGAGAEIQGSTDAFHFVHSLIDGDGQITARLDSVSNTDDWTKAGVMIRAGSSASDANAFLLVHPKNTKQGAFQHRTSAGSSTSAYGIDHLQAPLWLRLVKKGVNVSAYISHDGKCWKPRLERRVAGLTGDNLIGLAVTSRKAGQLATAKFSNVSILDTVEPFNVDCDRAKVDMDLPQPTTWKLKPGLLGGTSNWEYTTTNPNANATAQRCPFPHAENREWVKAGPDDPDCPEATLPANSWATTGFSGSWSTTVLGAGNTSNYRSIANTQPTFARVRKNTIHPGSTIAGESHGKSIWFRKVFSITDVATEKDSLMLWGRWNRAITVYINGVRATNHPEMDYETDSYRYLGLSKAARAALKAGDNVIGVRIDAGADGLAFFDMGLTYNKALAQLPHIINSTGTLPAGIDWISTFKEQLQEGGVPGGIIAWSAKRGSSENFRVSASVGYKDKQLTKDMPRNAVLRLASADKPLSDILIQKIIADPDYAHFNLSLDTTIGALIDDARLGLPVTADNVGWGIESFTLRHLLLMRVQPCWGEFTDATGVKREARVGEVTGHEHGEAAYSYLGISHSQFNADSMAEIVLRQPCHYRPSSDMSTDVYKYSNDAKFLLRYFAAKILATRGKTIPTYFREKILANSAHDKTVTIAHEALAGRNPREPAYMTRRLPAERSLGWEHYYALATSADAYLYMLNTYDFCDSGDNMGGLLSSPDAVGCGGGRGTIWGSRAYSGQSRGSDEWKRSFVFVLPVSYDHFTHLIDDRLKEIDWDAQHICTSSSNLIKNCDFANGTSSWSLSQSDATAKLIATRRVALVEVTKSGTTPEKITLSQLISSPVKAGTYSLKFHARVDGPFHMAEVTSEKENEWARNIKVTVTDDLTKTVLCQSSGNRIKVYMRDEHSLNGCQLASDYPAGRLRVNFHIGKPTGTSDHPINRFFLDSVRFNQ